jgi:hypothetical protein
MHALEGGLRRGARQQARAPSPAPAPAAGRLCMATQGTALLMMLRTATYTHTPRHPRRRQGQDRGCCQAVRRQRHQARRCIPRLGAQPLLAPAAAHQGDLPAGAGQGAQGGDAAPRVLPSWPAAAGPRRPGPSSSSGGWVHHRAQPGAASCQAAAAARQLDRDGPSPGALLCPARWAPSTPAWSAASWARSLQVGAAALACVPAFDAGWPAADLLQAFGAGVAACVKVSRGAWPLPRRACRNGHGVIRPNNQGRTQPRREGAGEPAGSKRFFC